MPEHLPLDKLKSGMVLQKPIFSSNGHILLEQETVLTQNHLRMMDRWGIREAVIISEEEMRAKKSQEIPEEKNMTFAEEEALLEEPWDPPADPDPEPMRVKLNDSDLLNIVEERMKVSTPPREPPQWKPFIYQFQSVLKKKKKLCAWHHSALKNTKKVITKVRVQRTVTRADILQVVEKLVSFSMDDRNIVAALSQIHHQGNYLLSQCINSSIITVLIGLGMGCQRAELIALGECALLHDVGMYKIPPQIWRKKGELNYEEKMIVQRHTTIGADILIESLHTDRQLCDLVAYQHHERMNGTGYPRNRKGPLLHEYSRIVKVADCYSALTGLRPHRPAKTPKDAIDHLLKYTSLYYDRNAVKCLIRMVSRYGIGSIVKLSDQRLAQVVASNPNAPFAPVVKIYTPKIEKDKKAEVNEEPEVIHLSDKKDLFVDKALKLEEIQENLMDIY